MPNEVIRTERADKLEDHYDIGDIVGKNRTITSSQSKRQYFFN